MKDEIVLVASTQNPLCRFDEISIKDLADVSFVGFYRTMNLRDFTDEFCQSVGNFTPTVVFETADSQALRYMISKNKGVALMPRKLFDYHSSDSLKIIPLKEKTYRTLVIAWHQNHTLTLQENNFLEYTKNWFRNL